MRIWTLLATVALVFACGVGTVSPVAAAYPDKPVELVVPAGAGGGLDTFVRFSAEVAKKVAGVNVPLRVTNVPGGAHTKGILYAYKAPADGYTVFSLSPSDVIADVFKKLDIKFTEEFVPICRMQHDTSIVAVSTKGRFKSMQEVIAFGKANPGKVSWGILSPGGIDDAVAGTVAKLAGIKITLVPFKGSGELNAAVLGGHVDLVQGEPVEVLELMKSGDMRPILVLSKERITRVSQFKDVPTGKELGLDTDLATWRGIAMKKGTPKEAIDYWVAVFKKIHDSEEYKKFSRENLLDLKPGWQGPEEFGKLWKDELKLFTEVFTELGRLKK